MTKLQKEIKEIQITLDKLNNLQNDYGFEAQDGSITPEDITFEDETIECSRCENEFSPEDLEQHNGICHKCYCEIEFQQYADGQPCDTAAAMERM